MKQDKTFSVPTVGISSLLVIFAVLCLTVFALLSVSTVQAQRRLADSANRTVEGYYEAECAAHGILAELRGGRLPGAVAREGDIYTYACRITDTQALAVRVEVKGADYQILRWQAVSTADWEADNRLPVFTGQTEGKG